jgi:hypothetical protein
LSEQKITMIIGEASGDPDATVFARKFISLLRLLESVDERSWQIPHPRYKWEISQVSKSSPMTLEMRPILRSKDVSEENISGKLLDGLERLSKSADPSLLSEGVFTSEDMGHIVSLGVMRKYESTMPTKLVFHDNGSSKTIVPTSNLVKNARKLKTTVQPKPDEYLAIEGLLRTITLDPREDMFTHVFEVVELDSGDEFVCQFDPSDAGQIGAHVGNYLFVEGVTRFSRGKGKPQMSVESYRLIPKNPISLEEVRKRGLRIPGGKSSAEFVRDMRSDIG